MRPKPLFTRVCLAPARLEPHWSRVLVVILLLVSQFSHISPVVLGTGIPRSQWWTTPWSAGRMLDLIEDYPDVVWAACSEMEGTYESATS